MENLMAETSFVATSVPDVESLWRQFLGHDFRMQLNEQDYEFLADFQHYADNTKPVAGHDAITEALSKVPDFAQYLLRDEYISRYGFALPSTEWIAAVKALNEPILSVGCGSGFLERLLENAGVNVLATDLRPPSGGKSNYPQQWPEFVKIRKYGAAAALKRYPSRSLLMSWPSYGGGWARKAALSLTPGRFLIYIGEWYGCTANDEFHDLLNSAQFERVGTVDLPTFSGIHDRCWIFRKI